MQLSVVFTTGIMQQIDKLFTARPSIFSTYLPHRKLAKLCYLDNATTEAVISDMLVTNKSVSEWERCTISEPRRKKNDFAYATFIQRRRSASQ